MAKKVEMDPQKVKENIKLLQSEMMKQGLDGFYVSSSDAYLNEYVPMDNCHRFYLTGFSGSTAEVLVPKEGKVLLYVDGRYHEQADLEVDASIVEVVKVKGFSLIGSLLEDVTKNKMDKLGLEADRTSLGLKNKLDDVAQTICWFDGEMENIINVEKSLKLKEIQLIDKKYRGKDTREKIADIMQENLTGSHFITAIDTLSWLTNCRGYHLPNQSSFLGKALLVKDKVFVFVAKEVAISEQAKNEEGIEWVFGTDSDVAKKIEEIKADYKLSKVCFDSNMLNFANYSMLERIFGEEKLESVPRNLVMYHALKSKEELAEMERGFARADKAIFNTIKWVKDNVAKGNEISELDLYNQTSIEYKNQGAKDQSFNTIAGVGPNGSIIHYGDSKAQIKIKDSDMILLDSGGYFDGGFATDTTRTFMASNVEPDKEYKRMFTLVLKGMLQCQNAIFPDKCSGAVLDGLARAPLYQQGLNYNHGTGHGVGIHVHEDGARISPVSNIQMQEGQVVSIEPGFYKPGFAGVRIENIAYVEKHPDFDGFLRFKPLVYIGMEPSLVDEDLMTKDELKWLAEYEEVCKERGTSFQ